MTSWTIDELNRIEAADELEIAPERSDGSLRKPTTIWIVRSGDDLFVRSYRGEGAAWFRAAKASQKGHISANGVDKDVTFVPETDPGVNDQVDAAYRAEYSRYGATFVDPMVAEAARASTLKLTPR